jgi:hypothetical protein
MMFCDISSDIGCISALKLDIPELVIVLRLLLVCFRRLILRIVGAKVYRVATASPWLLGCKISGMSLAQLALGLGWIALKRGTKLKGLLSCWHVLLAYGILRPELYHDFKEIPRDRLFSK